MISCFVDLQLIAAGPNKLGPTVRSPFGAYLIFSFGFTKMFMNINLHFTFTQFESFRQDVSLNLVFCKGELRHRCYLVWRCYTKYIHSSPKNNSGGVGVACLSPARFAVEKLNEYASRRIADIGIKDLQSERTWTARCVYAPSSGASERRAFFSDECAKSDLIACMWDLRFYHKFLITTLWLDF